MVRKKSAGRSCTICRHDERWRLELLKAGGANVDSLSKKFNVSNDAIYRHWNNHVSDQTKANFLVGPVELSKLAETCAREGDSILDYLRLCRTTLVGQLAAMSEANDAKGAAYVADKLRMLLETLARLTGEFGTLAQSTINIHGNVSVLTDSPAFAKIQSVLLKALAAHPDARRDVVAALRDLHAENARTPFAAKTIEHLAPTEGSDHVAA